MDPYFYEKEKREMAETQLHFVKYAAEEILEYISVGGRIEEWYQNKLSKVHSDMEGMHSWMEGEKRRTGMVSESVAIIPRTYPKDWSKEKIHAAAKKHQKDDIKRTIDANKEIQALAVQLKKQRDAKMRGESVEQINEYGNTKKGQKMLDMVHSRATQKSISDKAKGDLNYAKKNLKTAYGAWKRMTDKQRFGEEVEHLEEKNVPTSPEKWSRAKAMAKAKFDVYPSAYANGWAAKKYKEMGGGWKSVKEETEVNEDLRKWFDPKHPEGGWKRINSKGEAVGPCAREPGEPKPKCMSNEKRASLTKKERAAAVRTKRKHDPNPERKGEPINVSNYGKGKISEQYDDTPFEPPYSNRPSTVTDKSGAVHGPMSRAKHLAKMAAKRQAERLKDKPTMKTAQDKPEMHRESFELNESRRAEIVREAMKVSKDKKKKESNKTDKFEPEPELSTAINKTDV